ncbi:hypothetical protein AB205_0027400 [Aquarana catesbeiana]|uniref:Uncharacterized protein n=1 Tax=Aquarana catesbeiana TaxID=8400 RepID=A0A2G9QCA9_AQUCT|nr:hypothetical protein AB205_0027400 [Aquarana catesbeiana]
MGRHLWALICSTDWHHWALVSVTNGHCWGFPVIGALMFSAPITCPGLSCEEIPLIGTPRHTLCVRRGEPINGTSVFTCDWL